MVSQVDELAKVRGVSRSEAIRISVDLGLPLLRLGLALNTQRAITILEHTQLALTTIISREYPELGDDLIAEAVLNVREHHG